MTKLNINNQDLDISYQKRHEMRDEYSKIISNMLDSEHSFNYETTHLKFES